MKQRGKILLMGICVLGMTLFAAVLSKIERHSAEPFPGAIVVLDSPEWRARAIRQEYYQGYEWLAPDTVFSMQAAGKDLQVMRQTVSTRGATLSQPEPLPHVLINASQWLRSLSPDGKTLCIAEKFPSRNWRFRLASIHGTGKPIVIDAWSNHLIWSPDSRFLFATWWHNGAVLQRYDARTGAMTETKLQIKNPQDYPTLTQITPDGRMLCFKSSTQSLQGVPPSGCSWTLSEIQGNRVVEIAAPHIQNKTPAFAIPSPTGERILWMTSVSQTSLLRKITKILNRQRRSFEVAEHWDVCDMDGKNWHSLGAVALPENGDVTKIPRLQWTPDGKGVHFIKDGKLCYLAVP